MKKLILIIALAFIVSAASSQTISGIQISSIESEYLDVIITKKLVKNQYTYRVDYGQITDEYKADETLVKDKDGKVMFFSGPVNVLKFFGPLGYDYVDRTTSNAGNVVSLSILLKRKR